MAVFALVVPAFVLVGWLDRPAGEGVLIDGTVTSVSYSTERYTPRRVDATAKLRDGTELYCHTYRDIKIGDNVTAARRKSRVLGRTVYELLC